MNAEQQALESKDMKIHPIERDWKYYIGMVFFIWSFASIPIALIIPTLGLPAATATGIASGVIVSGEIGFWLAAALLGKPFVNTITAKIKGFFKPKKPVEIRPVSRGRFRFGVVIHLLGTTAAWYVALVMVIFKFPWTPVLVTMITGEVLFFVSLFVLGGDFWERLMRLYQWPDDGLT